MRHIGRFKPAVLKSLLTGKDLIFITCDLVCWFVKVCNRLVIVVDGNALRAIDVIHKQITFSAAYLAYSAAQTECAGLDVGNAPITV